MSDNESVKIPADVAYALDFIRESGRCSMFDRLCVQALASESNEYEAVVWLEDHKREYGKVVINGWEAEDDV